MPTTWTRSASSRTRSRSHAVEKASSAKPPTSGRRRRGPTPSRCSARWRRCAAFASASVGRPRRGGHPAARRRHRAEAGRRDAAARRRAAGPQRRLQISAPKPQVYQKRPADATAARPAAGRDQAARGGNPRRTIWKAGDGRQHALGSFKAQMRQDPGLRARWRGYSVPVSRRTRQSPRRAPPPSFQRATAKLVAAGAREFCVGADEKVSDTVSRRTKYGPGLKPRPNPSASSRG